MMTMMIVIIIITSISVDISIIIHLIHVEGIYIDSEPIQISSNFFFSQNILRHFTRC